jgi:hypothetical protein
MFIKIYYMQYQTSNFYESLITHFFYLAGLIVICTL